MKFEHFIITRFNLPIYSKIKTGTISSLNDNYIEERLHLFMNYCLPSIIQQSTQKFKWLVLFDERTPSKYKKLINSIHNKYQNFIPCYLDLNNYKEIPKEYIEYYKEYISYLDDNEYVSIHNNINEYIRMIYVPKFINDCIHKHSTIDTDFILTTRIDNDDAFHKDFINNIQLEAQKHKSLILLDYINGYRFLLDKRIVNKFCTYNGHFTTLMEQRNKSLHTVMYWSHNIAHKIIPIKHINTLPMYIELIHDTNVSNVEQKTSLYDFIYAIKNFKASDFGYKNIRLSLWNNLRTFLKLLAIHTKNYLIYRFKKQDY